MRSIITITVGLLPLLLPVGVLGKVCYDASGNENPGVYDCNPDASISACCKVGEVCYSNGLCRGSNHSADLSDFYVNGCTDRSWSSPCISNCRSSNGNGIETCTTAGLDEYCCYGLSGCNCNNSTLLFSLAAGDILTTLPATIATASATSSSIRSTTSSLFSSGTTVTSSLSSIAAASATSTNNSPIENNSGKTIGIGVGVGVGVAALLAIGFATWLIRRRRSKTQKASSNMAVPAATAGYHEKGTNYNIPEMDSRSQQMAKGPFQQDKALSPVELEHPRPRPYELP